VHNKYNYIFNFLVITVLYYNKQGYFRKKIILNVYVFTI